jgi:hypothetical protein
VRRAAVVARLQRNDRAHRRAKIVPHATVRRVAPAGEKDASPEPRERVDLRIVVVFAALSAALLTPFGWQALKPTDAQDLRDFASTLASDAREATQLLDRRDSLTRPYYSAELEDLGESINSQRGALLHLPVSDDAAALLRQLTDLAETFKNATEDAALAWNDLGKRAEARSTLERVARDADSLAGGP